jgi:hypothetical protein
VSEETFSWFPRSAINTPAVDIGKTRLLLDSGFEERLENAACVTGYLSVAARVLPPPRDMPELRFVEQSI